MPSRKEVDPERVEDLMATMREAGKAAKTRRNALLLLAKELEQLRQRSVHHADDDLVFAHPAPAKCSTIRNSPDASRRR
jgi:hypothetical protein